MATAAKKTAAKKAPAKKTVAARKPKEESTAKVAKKTPARKPAAKKTAGVPDKQKVVLELDHTAYNRLMNLAKMERLSAADYVAWHLLNVAPSAPAN